MKISVRTLCLIFIISCGSTKLTTFEEAEDRDYIPHPPIGYFDVAPRNRTLQKRVNIPESFRHHHEIQYDLDDLESKKVHIKRYQSYYDGEHNYEYYSRSNRNDSYDRYTPTGEGIKVLRTYGRGKAQVTRQGQTVDVPNEYGRNANRGQEKGPEKSENEIKSARQRGACRECPPDQTVIASKGNAFAILPEPCPLNPRMWNHHSGPRPGSQIQGVHTIRGYIGPRKKFCQYEYQVLVRRCEPLKEKEDTFIMCSAHNSWGSICNVTCGNEKKLVGLNRLECNEDLTWSNPLPSCMDKVDCTNPKVKAKSKILCHKADMTEIEGDFIPNGSTCKFRQNEKDILINCKDGRWRVIRKNKSSSNKNKQEKKDPCKPNPCQNGGTCLKTEPKKGPPICKCRPQTRGTHCEMRECYYNICENDGLCFFQNEERICYCNQGYSGDICQNYTPQ